MEEKDQEKVKVTDKRKFDTEGNRKPGSEEPEQEEKMEEKQKPSGGSATGVGEGAANTEQASGDISGQAEPEEIDFISFIISLATHAMAGLGVIPDPGTQKVSQNLPVAKQMIDIISMLREKTKGNLEANEITTVDNILYDLRMKYVEMRKQKGSKD